MCSRWPWPAGRSLTWNNIENGLWKCPEDVEEMRCFQQTSLYISERSVYVAPFPLNPRRCPSTSCTGFIPASKVQIQKVIQNIWPTHPWLPGPKVHQPKPPKYSRVSKSEWTVNIWSILWIRLKDSWENFVLNFDPMTCRPSQIHHNPSLMPRWSSLTNPPPAVSLEWMAAHQSAWLWLVRSQHWEPMTSEEVRREGVGSSSTLAR